MARTELDVIEGDTWVVELNLREPDGTPYSFGSQAPYFQLRATLGGTVIVELTEGDGITLDYPAAGDITLEIPSTYTAGICTNRNVVTRIGDLELRLAGSPVKVTTMAAFQFNVSPEATSV